LYIALPGSASAFACSSGLKLDASMLLLLLHAFCLAMKTINAIYKHKLCLILALN